MKKRYFGISAAVLSLGMLAGCGEDTAVEEVASVSEEQSTTEANADSKNEAAEDTETEESLLLTNENIEEIIAYSGTGEGDQLISAKIEGEEVKALIELAPDDIFSAADLAITRYSQVSDELLEYEGWEVLSVEYVEAGTISMNRSEAETNDYGMDYFPVQVIESKLK